MQNPISVLSPRPPSTTKQTTQYLNIQTEHKQKSAEVCIDVSWKIRWLYISHFTSQLFNITPIHTVVDLPIMSQRISHTSQRLWSKRCRITAPRRSRTCRAGYATVSSVPKTPMSRFENDRFINFEQLDANIKLIRDR